MSFRRILVLGVAVLVGCAPVSRGGAKVRPAMALARGAWWSGLTIQPPYLSGPHFTMTLQHHALSGWITGPSAPAGALRVQIEEDGASGHGPLGPVAMDFQWSDDGGAVDGVWNGSRVHVAITAAGLRGTVADNAKLPDRLSPWRDRAYRDSSCEYALDSRQADGAFEGTSICAGMPQPTRLEIPAAAATWLSPSELLTVLTAFLSAPPVPPSEGASPVGQASIEVDGFDFVR
jgi:hypothetical protein